MRLHWLLWGSLLLAGCTIYGEPLSGVHQVTIDISGTNLAGNQLDSLRVDTDFTWDLNGSAPAPMTAVTLPFSQTEQVKFSSGLLGAGEQIRIFLKASSAAVAPPALEGTITINISIDGVLGASSTKTNYGTGSPKLDWNYVSPDF